MNKRLATYIFLALSFFFLPWWATIFFSLAAIFIVSSFYESAVIAMIALSSFTGIGDHIALIAALSIAVFVFTAENMIKPRLRWYDKVNEMA